MQKSLLTFLVWAMMATVQATAGQIVPSNISHVTLFSNQALVQRTASAAVDKGTATMEVEITPFRIEPDSVSARVKGRGEIISVQYRSVPVAASPREKIGALERKLRTLERAKQKLSDRRQALDRQAAFLSAFVDFSKVQVPKEIQTRLPSAEELSRTLAFLDTGYAQIHARRQEVDQQGQDLDRQIQAAERELAALGRQGRKTRQFIEIVFNADRAQTLEIQAAYLVRNASWKPVYKVDVPSSLTSAQLTIFSQARQKTGEDWGKTHLTVSTAVPLKGTRLPEPSPWILDIPRVEKQAERKMKRMAEMETAPAAIARKTMAMAGNKVQDAVEAGFAQAQRQRTALSFSYELPRPLDMVSRDKETTLPLMTKTLTGAFSHFSVPRKQPLTFLVLEAESDKELLAGPMNVQFAGQYVGKTYIGEKRAGERFKLGLGADRDVRVKREKIKDKVRETRFGSFDRDRTIRELSYRITAENLKEVPVTLNIIDSVPVSRTDRINVRDLEISPKPTREKVSGQEGVLGWQMDLAPGQSQTIDIDFVVVYPKELPPIGL